MIQFGVSHFSSDTIFLVLESFLGRSLFWTFDSLDEIVRSKDITDVKKDQMTYFINFHGNSTAVDVDSLIESEKGKCHRYFLSTLFVILKIIINTKKFVEF